MRKNIAFIMILALILTMIPGQTFAAISSVKAPKQVNQLISSEHLEHNYVNVYTDGSSLYFDVQTPIKASEFNALVRRTVPASSKSEWDSRYYPYEVDGYYCFSGGLTKSWPMGTTCF